MRTHFFVWVAVLATTVVAGLKAGTTPAAAPLVAVSVVPDVRPGADAGQQTASAEKQQPAVTFKVEINYVEIDAVVTDGQGKFVDNLAQQDFQVTENGVRQTVTAFARVDLPVERFDPPLYKTAPVEPDVRSNRQAFNGRGIVILLDDLMTDARRTNLVRAAAKQFVRRYVGANDMVAVVQTGGRTSDFQDFTSSQPRLLSAIDRFVGRKIPSSTLVKLDDYYSQVMMGGGEQGTAGGRDTSEMERRTRARTSLLALKKLSDFLGNIHGRRKAVVWFGEGIDYDIESPFGAPAAEGFTTRDPHMIRDALREAMAAANRANVSYYSVDPRGFNAGLEDALDIASVPVLLDQGTAATRRSPLR